MGAPSPLAGEGGSRRRRETDEGFFLTWRRPLIGRFALPSRGEGSPGAIRCARLRQGVLPHESDPLHRACLSPAQRGRVADPSGHRRLFVEPLHVLRHVHGATEKVSPARRGGGVRNHQALCRRLCRRHQARVSRRRRRHDPFHAPPRRHSRSHPARHAGGAAGVELLPAAQCEEEIRRGIARTRRPRPEHGLCRRRIRRRCRAGEDQQGRDLRFRRARPC